LIVCTGPLYACSCKEPPPPKEALKNSSAVFSGKVTAVAAAGEYEKAVTIEITASWKGVETAKEVVVYTPNNDGECGYRFEKGKSYLIYATLLRRGEEKALSTHICTRTKALEKAVEDIKELGDPSK
jgi:hypothetical protein